MNMAYVDINTDGLTVVIPRDDLEVLKRVLSVGIPIGSIATVVGSSYDGIYLAASLVIDPTPKAWQREAERLVKDVEDSLREEGFCV